MLIEFTKHALERIKARNIEKNEVIETLANPEKVIKDNSGLCIAQKKFTNQLLRVFYREEEKGKTIITAYKASDFERYIKSK